MIFVLQEPPVMESQSHFSHGSLYLIEEICSLPSGRPLSYGGGSYVLSLKKPHFMASAFVSVFPASYPLPHLWGAQIYKQ